MDMLRPSVLVMGGEGGGRPPLGTPPVRRRSPRMLKCRKNRPAASGDPPRSGTFPGGSPVPKKSSPDQIRVGIVAVPGSRGGFVLLVVFREGGPVRDQCLGPDFGLQGVPGQGAGGQLLD